MTDLGKVDRAFFDALIYPHLGAARDDVTLGPKHGVDFGVLDVGGEALVVATDPISILPQLGFEQAARFALHIVLADVAVSGIAPSHLAISFSLPPEITDEQFATIWETIDAECRELGISIVTGHTARYSGIEYPWVGAATVFGVGDHTDLVRPDGANPGDNLLVTKGPAAEAVGLLTSLFGDQMNLDDETLEQARARLEDTSVVRDALVAGAAGGVTAMHDATEGGIHGGLVELARGAGVRIDFDPDAVPMLPGVAETCAYLDMDPWASTSCGTLLLTVEPGAVARVVAALEAEDILVAEAGTVTEGEGVYAAGERIEHPDVDPSWAVYAKYAEDR
ncbi:MULTISPECIES: AIR synthase family protein [unclassified Haladaptatus]|uniref:AIR synthase family protein n=1 Tax=unclassified Haladaptatus TaxID=2622732 RepID=UPI0023E7C832|nr:MULTISPECIES: AIR synthase family protein [unclassified Haladaptatus]